MVRTRWSSVLLLYGVGLIASSFLGKIAPVGPLLQRDLGLTLAQLGWMVSMITAVAACSAPRSAGSRTSVRAEPCCWGW